jgi:hypothetical protein
MHLSLRLVERLDFTLPDFTRLSWVSEEARWTWEPRLKSISRTWFDIEWLSVLAKIRSCSLTRLSPEALTRATVRWTSHGLSVLPLQVEGASDQSYSSTQHSIEPGKPTALRVVLVQFHQRW